jgi:hypothetical protein
MDIKVHPRDFDLVIGTHARGIYILDDIMPLQELARLVKDGAKQGTGGLEKVILFKPMRATRYTPMSDVSSLSDKIVLARNNPYGAIITYLPRRPRGEGPVARDLDASGRVIRRLRETSGRRGPRRLGLRKIRWRLVKSDEMWFSQGGWAARLPGVWGRLGLGETLEQSFGGSSRPSSAAATGSYGQAIKKLAECSFRSTWRSKNQKSGKPGVRF